MEGRYIGPASLGDGDFLPRRIWSPFGTKCECRSGPDDDCYRNEQRTKAGSCFEGLRVKMTHSGRRAPNLCCDTQQLLIDVVQCRPPALEAVLQRSEFTILCFFMRHF
jgi:hypothetical protein